MDLKRKLMGALFAVIAGSGLLLACGPEEGAACDYDTDCGDEELCAADGYCAFECGDGLPECLTGEVCTTRANANDGSKVCLSAGGTGNNNTGNNNADKDECKDNDDCVGVDNICDTSGTFNVCKVIGDDKDYYAIKVGDVTTDAGRCGDKTKGEPSPGTKLSYIQLVDKGGSSLGYGERIGDNITGDSAYNEVISVLNGSAPALDGECAESFTMDNGIALGCGGHVMVQFLDGSGNRIKLENGNQVFVGVYGNICNDQFDEDGLDKYNVYLCDTASDDVGSSDSSCSATPLNPSPKNGMGYVDIKLPS